MQTFLRMKGLKYVFLSIDGHNPKHNHFTDSCWKDMIDSPIINIHDIIGFRCDHPQYYDGYGGHPNSLGHRVIANAIKERL